MSYSSLAHLYGCGVFTTIRIIGGEQWLWEKHWRRLQDSAAKLGIDTAAHSEYMVRRGLDESIPDLDRLKAQKARITISDERSSWLWSDAQVPVPTNVSFLVSPLNTVQRPFRLGVSPHSINSTSPIAGMKTCNYLEQIMALDEAKARGVSEAIRLNERGRITSACTANVFWLKHDRLYTPPLLTGCLTGTTREFVMENLDVEEVAVGIEELQNARAIFLTSAGLGVVAVDEFDGRPLSASGYPILDIIPK
ncbi:MAG TPA: aminotransferase class IV [Pyrinomonadaceae bacterium]|jgi:branched-subunit amino acid aminotransferase/4-amino-4-deoxychorismate lyase|nr:aminotransferase class IV [Pyrinomonadaceae bacterium]